MQEIITREKKTTGGKIQDEVNNEKAKTKERTKKITRKITAKKQKKITRKNNSEKRKQVFCVYARAPCPNLDTFNTTISISNLYCIYPKRE